MLCSYFFKAYRYKNRTFCIKIVATKALKTSSITGSSTNLTRFLLFEKERKLRKMMFLNLMFSHFSKSGRE